jgi:foldase protein PrsA
MIAIARGRKVVGPLFALAVLGVVGGDLALAQVGRGRSGATNPPAATAPAQAQGEPARPARLELTAIPVNPTDPIAIINDEVITRAQLADECVARKGEEILETLIARKLIEQALRVHKMEVTAAEINQEIDNVAMRVAGIGREAWLRTLDKERGISPIQYARDIIYPALALRKLAAGRVQVTPEDQKNAFEAQYGEKLHCRMIMVDKLMTAKEIWDELRKNPGGFEKLAMDRSIDAGSRSLGGLLAEPISRHAYPQTVSDAAFYQLVDGDPRDKDPSHKPKDGDFTGPIQVAESSWIILRRERIKPATNVDPNDPRVKKQSYEMIYEVKLKEAMGMYMNELMQKAAIDNKLTGTSKQANELPADPDVILTGGQKPNSAGQNSAQAVANPAGSTSPKMKVPTPAALPADVARQADSLTRPANK